jgi:acetolactate synthase small subunit
MSKVYKTIRGKGIDIDKIKLKNETTVAVSNMRVNARGDLLGSGNQIAASRNQIMDRVYAVPDSSVGYSPTDSGAAVQRQAMIDTVQTPEAAPVAEAALEPVQAPAPTAVARGSLASSVAKTKNDGPSRI